MDCRGVSGGINAFPFKKRDTGVSLSFKDILGGVMMIFRDVSGMSVAMPRPVASQLVSGTFQGDSEAFNGVTEILGCLFRSVSGDFGVFHVDSRSF